MPEYASRKDAAGETAALHREVLADERTEIGAAKRSVDDLFVEVHPGGIGSRFGLGKQLRSAISINKDCLNYYKGRNFSRIGCHFQGFRLFILHNRKIELSLYSAPTSKSMKKIIILLSAALLTAGSASAQSPDDSPKENFPSTETTLSQIGQAEAHPNAKHVRRPTRRPSPPR